MRQDEAELIKAINEISLGRPSQETIAFIKSLDRPLDVPAIKKKLLVSQNILANIYNAIKLQEINKPEIKYISIDSGAQVALDKIKVDKVGKRWRKQETFRNNGQLYLLLLLHWC